MHQSESRGQAMAGPWCLLTLFGLEVAVDFKGAHSARTTSKSIGCTANNYVYVHCYMNPRVWAMMMSLLVDTIGWLTQFTHRNYTWGLTNPNSSNVEEVFKHIFNLGFSSKTSSLPCSGSHRALQSCGILEIWNCVVMMFHSE